MSDDRPRAPTFGPPITIPSAYFLGLVAYNAWCDAHLDDPVVDWMELSEGERAMWQRIATKVAERIRDATSAATRSATTCHRPGAGPSGGIATPSTSAVAGIPIRPKLAPMTKATVGCRSSRELAAAALARFLQGLQCKLTVALGARLWTDGWHQPRVWAGHEFQRASSQPELGLLPALCRCGLCPRRPRWPSPGGADSDSTAGSASAVRTVSGTANAATAERN